MSQPTSAAPSRKKTTFSLLVLAALTGIIVLLFKDHWAEITAALSQLSAWQVLVVLAIGLSYPLLEGCVAWVIVRSRIPGFRLRQGIDTAWCGTFGNVVTLGAGAVPVQTWYLHRCGLPKERLAIPAQPAAPGRERPLDRKGILSLLLDDRREHTPEQELFLTYVKGLSGVQRIVDGYLGKSQSALVKNLRSNPDSFARTIMQTIYSDARRNGIDHLPSLARELIEPELRRHEAARPKPSSEPKSEE